MALAQIGNPPSPTPGTQQTTTPAPTQQSISQTSIQNWLNTLLTGGGAGLTGPLGFPGGGGQAGSYIQTLLGSTAPQTGMAAAQIADLQNQIGLGQYGVGLEQGFAQQQAGLQQQGFGLQAQGLGLAGQGLTLQQQLLAAQRGAAPQQQAIEQAQFGIGQRQATQGLQNLATQYGLQVPGMESGFQAAGAGGTQGATNAMKAAKANYQTQRTQGLEALRSAGLGQQAEKIGYGLQQKGLAEQAAQQQIQRKQLGLSGQQLQLSEQQAKDQLINTLQSAGLGGAINTAQLQSQITGTQAQALNNILQTLALGSFVAPAAGAKK